MGDAEPARGDFDLIVDDRNSIQATEDTTADGVEALGPVLRRIEAEAPRGFAQWCAAPYEDAAIAELERRVRATPNSTQLASIQQVSAHKIG